MKITIRGVKEILAGQIGVEPEDLNPEDSFVEDLHMGNGDLTDFAHNLESLGINPGDIDFAEIETLGELLETLGLVAEPNE